MRAGSRGRRRSTACSRTRSSSSSRSAPTRSPAEPADALDPRLSRNGHGPLPAFVAERRGARGRRRARLRSPTRTSSSRPTDASSSTSPARTGSTPSWCYALPELQPPDRPADREPGLLRDRRAARARADRRRRRPGERRRRRQVGHLRRGARAEGPARTPPPCSRTSRRTRSARTSTRPRSRSCSASRSPSCRTSCPLRRGLVCTCYVTASEDPRPLLEAAYAGSHVVDVIEIVPDLARLQGTDAAEVAAFEDARPAAGS